MSTTQIEFERCIENLGRGLRAYFRFRCREDFEDLAQETLRRIAESSRKETPRDFEAYAFGIARHVFSEYVRAAGRERRLVEGLRVLQKPYHAEDTELKHRCLDRCINALPARERELLELYYFRLGGGQKPGIRKTLAVSLSMSPNALRLAIHRIKDRLAGCVSSYCEDSDNQRGGPSS